jgi:hypothetical protein
MNLKLPTNQNLYSQRANEFRKRRGWKRYMMVPNETLEKEMLDPVLPNEIRVLYAIRRYSWGNLADFAVLDVWLKEENKPRPLTQKQLGENIGLSSSTVNDSVQKLKQVGYLKTDHPYLYPIDKLDPLDTDSYKERDPSEPERFSPFLRFRSFLAKKGVEHAIILDQLSEKRKQHQAEALKLSVEIKAHEKWLWTAYRSYQRGKNPFGFNDPGDSPEKVA